MKFRQDISQELPVSDVNHNYKNSDLTKSLQRKNEILLTDISASPVSRKPINDLSPLHSKNKKYFPYEYEKCYTPPKFTYKELKECIPPHFFERSLLKSTRYLLENLCEVALLLGMAIYLHRHVVSPWSYVLWPVYWYFQGVALGGLWVLAHECGHNGFSDYKIIDHTIGFILHSSLMIPYFSFRVSHALHHAGTSSMEKDPIYIPQTRSKYCPKRRVNINSLKIHHDPSAWQESLESSPLYILMRLLFFFLLAWPLYIAINFTGKKVPGRLSSHFLPSSPFFLRKQKLLVLLSTVGVLITIGGLAYFTYVTSFATFVKFYGVPYFVCNFGVTTVTLLHHHDVYVPHYSSKEWNFIRGALATVDRDSGPFLNRVLHNVTNSHVVHHLFPRIPFYNAIKATPYLKEKLGEYYLYDDTPFWKAIWRVMAQCHYVEDTGDVLFYR